MHTPHPVILRALLLGFAVGLVDQTAWAGKILITSEPIALDSDKSAHQKSVGADAPIYALLQLDKPVSAVFFSRDKEQGTFDIDLNVAVDGTPSGSIRMRAPSEAADQTRLLLPLSADPGAFGTDLKSARAASGMMKVFSEQSAGKHKILLQASGRKPVVASGTFTLTLTEADKQQLAANYEGVAQAVEDKKASLRTLPEPGAFADAEAIRMLEEAVRAKYPSTVRVVVMSDAWDIKTDPMTQQPVRRSVLAAWGKVEGDVCYQDRGWWAQQHQGGGQYTPTFGETSLVSTSSQSGRMDCDEIR